MKSFVEALAGQLALVLAGSGALRAARVVKPMSLANLFKAGGLAYLVGVALTMQTCVLALVLGVPFGLVTFGVVCLICGMPLLLDVRPLMRHRQWAWPDRWRRPSLPRRLTSEQTIVVVAAAGFAVLALIGLITLGNRPILPGDYDAWNTWTRKAGLMFLEPHLPLAVLGSPASGFVHPDYPLVLSLLEALHLRALHRYELSSVHTVLWTLGIAFVWAGIYLGSRVVRPALCLLLFPGVFMLTVVQLLTAYADVPMAFFLGLGTLALGLWLESARRPDLALAMMLFAGAAGMKNEGLVGAVVVIGAGIVVLACYRRFIRAGELAVGGLAMGVFAILPWHIWLLAHHLKGDIPFPGGFSPSYLIDRFSRLGPGLTGLYDQLTNVQTIAIAVPIALAVVLVRIWRREWSPLLWFYLLAGLLYFVALCWAYWANPGNLGFLITTSANRVYVGLAFIAVVAILHVGLPAPSSAAPPAEGSVGRHSNAELASFLDRGEIQRLEPPESATRGIRRRRTES